MKRTDDKPHNTQGNRRVREVMEPKAGQSVGEQFRQALALAGSALGAQAVKDLGSGQRPVGLSLWQQMPVVLKWSDIEGSGPESLMVCCPNASLYRDLMGFGSSHTSSASGPYQFWGVSWCSLRFLLAAVP